MSRKTSGNGVVFVAAICLGLMVTSARGGSLYSPAAPTADPGSNWSFAVFGDTRGNGTNTPSEPCINTPVIQAICAAITNDGVLCAIVPGDFQHGQYGGYVALTIDQQLALWTNAVSALGRAGIPYYAVRGNHETYSDDETNRPAHADWTKQIGRYMPTNGPAGEIGMTYSIPCGNALFIGLDTYDGTNDNYIYHAINQAWLDTQLAANTRTHLFVFGHEPAFQADADDPCLSENLPERNLFWDSIGTANARAYLTGHSHLYGRCLVSISNGPALRQIIVGTGGAPLVNWDGQYIEPAGSGALIVPEVDYTPANTYGYTLVRVSGNHVVMEYKSTTNLTTWTTNDVFQYTVAATPTNVHASDGTYLDRVLVSWAAAADASGYEVWRGTNASGAGRARIGCATATSFSDGAAVPTVLYYYWVRAINTDGAGQYSASDSGFLGVVGPLITANGMVGNVHLNSSDTVSIAVQMMNMEPYLGVNVDWWVVVCAGSSWYYLNSALQWIQENNSLNWHPVYQGGLGNVPATEVLNITGLGTGLYTCYFAVDYPMDGILNADGPILVDSVTVTVQ